MVEIVFKDYLLPKGKTGLVYEVTTHPEGIPIDEHEEYEAISVAKDPNGRFRVKHSDGALNSTVLKADIPDFTDAVTYARNHTHLLDSNFPRDSDGNIAESEWEVDLSDL